MLHRLGQKIVTTTDWKGINEAGRGRSGGGTPGVLAR